MRKKEEFENCGFLIGKEPLRARGANMNGKSMVNL
jgi:hypothetical protein